MPDLTIGFARADITPPLGTPMIGYFYNGKTPRTAQSVHDPLYASAMVVRSGGTGAALVGVDTLSIKRRTATAAREAVARALGIPIENIMVSASHTHSGPAVCTALGYKADERAISVLHDGIVTAAREAAAQARPLRLGVACGAEHRFTHCRRHWMRSGVVMCQPPPFSPDVLRPEGPEDPEIGVLAALDDRGQVQGLWFNYAVHAQVCGGAAGEISADWPGYVRRAIDERLGRPIVSVFGQGAAGNMNAAGVYQRSRQWGHPLAAEMGRGLSENILNLCETVRASADSAAVRGAERWLELPMREVTDEMLAWAREAKAAGKEYEPRFNGPAPLTAFEGLALAEKRKRHDKALALVQAIRIGPAAIVGVPCEFFSDLGLRIKRESPIQPTFVVELANGCVGYVPTKDAHAHGGYETILSRTSKLVPEAGDVMVGTALELLRQLSV